MPAPGSKESAVRIDQRVQGTVVFVNPGLRIVVMDFPIRRLPAMGQRLQLYREERKVGEVKVSGPIIETTAGGDVMSGEARLGDEVREE
jgi:hypothetical protein